MTAWITHRVSTSPFSMPFPFVNPCQIYGSPQRTAQRVGASLEFRRGICRQPFETVVAEKCGAGWIFLERGERQRDEWMGGLDGVRAFDVRLICTGCDERIRRLAAGRLRAGSHRLCRAVGEVMAGDVTVARRVISQRCLECVVMQMPVHGGQVGRHSVGIEFPCGEHPQKIRKPRRRRICGAENPQARA